MTLPGSLSTDIASILKQIVSPSISIRGFTTLSGGCINNGGRLSTSAGHFFIKWNDALRFPEMFSKEAEGLKILSSTETIDIPNVVATGQSDTTQFIIMEFIEQGSRVGNFWETLGQQLARLHRTSQSAFGLSQDNYIGSLPQSNTLSTSWIQFFIEQRLQPQLAMAHTAGEINSSFRQQCEKLFAKLPSLLIEEIPALLHGDLWSGNLITNDRGLPCLIDPAVYYGNREVDLAMTQLFGGFNSTFLDAYHEVFPLAAGYHERFELYNLYPLLVHVNLFGGGYATQAQTVVKKFVF